MFNFQVEPIISLMNDDPPWPCAITSMSELLQFQPGSKDAVRGIETILCMNKEFLDEWLEYLAAKNNTVKVSKHFNALTGAFASYVTVEYIIKRQKVLCRKLRTTMIFVHHTFRVL